MLFIHKKKLSGLRKYHIMPLAGAGGIMWYFPKPFCFVPITFAPIRVEQMHL